MTNIAGKSYAINVITPTRWKGLINRLIFRAGRTPMIAKKFDGLATLSLIHYARWVIVSPHQFPRLSKDQPKETIKLTYELFFSNFNGSWNQYIDSFSMSIPAGLDLFWFKNVEFPKSVPINAFHRYINANQIATNYYYNAYPLATSNDVKSAQRVHSELKQLADTLSSSSAEEFKSHYINTLVSLQHDLSLMEETPIVSLANEAAKERKRIQALELT